MSALPVLITSKGERVTTFLARARSLEMTVTESVRIWLETHPGKPGRISVYFDDVLLEEVPREAERLNLTKSQLLVKAWELAKEEIKKFRTPEDHP